jgi:RNA polymerase sigma factor (sigma-70 family)
MVQEGSITGILDAFSRGDNGAVRKIWERYLPRMMRLANRVLGHRSRRVVDEQDVADSAFASFWRRTREGEFPFLRDRDDLWALLSTITTRKALAQIRKESAEKRGGGTPTASLNDVAEPGAVVAYAEIDLFCEELLERLGEDELRAIALLRLMGFSNPEIAEELDCSLRRIERKLQLIKREWSRPEQ